MKTENSTKIISYLTFRLGDEDFAAHVSKVLNILEMVKITKVPRAPEYMKGVINLRGMVLPVIDTRIKFGLPTAEVTNNTCIVVMEIESNGESIHVGALVDQVNAVLEIDDADILPPPSIGTSFRSDFISGMVKVDERFIMILDIERILTTEELFVLAQNQVQD